MLVLRLGDEAHLPRDASGSFRTPLGATDVVTGPLALTPVCPQLGCAWGPSVFGAGVPPSSSRVEFARGQRPVCRCAVRTAGVWVRPSPRP